MIDIHTHILPGIDDGAETFEEAYRMAEMAVRSGVTALVATPHSNHEIGFVNYESDRLEKVFLELKRILGKEKMPLQVYRGMEIWASEDMVQKIEHRKLVTLNNSRYVLVEFDYGEEHWWIDGMVQELLDAGLVPVIAHPERYYCVQENPNFLYEWRMRGTLAQMNKGSVLGKLGTAAACAARILLRHNMYSCIASDAHHSWIRTTDMVELERYLQHHYSSRYRDMLLYENPLCMIQNRVIRNGGQPVKII